MNTIQSWLRPALLILCILGLGACKSTAVSNSERPTSTAEVNTKPPAGTVLTHEAASIRHKQIGKISYVLWFGFDEKEQDFQGRTVLLFDLKSRAKDASKTLEIDFEDGKIQTITVNGVAIPSSQNYKDRYDRNKIRFQLSELSPNGNRIEIAYSHPYSHDGEGLHRFVDPVDNNVYLYSNFEPYKAHRLFPCFDQPDLKATYELTVDAPEEWTVISNTLERDIARVDGRKSWAFPPTPPFSTYVFALHAGPYSSWKSDANGIPIRLFSRKTMAQYVDFHDWFEITRNGLEFYGLQFGYPYPFTKYDQILVPDFNPGAMENVGAVTFNEKFIFRTKVTHDRHRDRADVILHEMAHMWFGDLVTMKWWNGLWLNESFATLMAAWSTEETTKYKGKWQSFFARKQSAYSDDQLVTTHPIELPVHDTHQAEANFDRITYEKGAAVLKALRFYIGQDDFREGLQRYFQKYAFHNTTIGDFIHMLAEASGKDLQSWQKLWLLTSGPNTLKAEWKCDADEDDGKKRISGFSLLQGIPGDEVNEKTPDNTLRPHRTRIAFFNLPKKGHGTIDKPNKILDVTYSSAKSPVNEAVGLPCPDFVFPNYDDEDYAKLELDETSLAFVFHHLDRLANPFVRQMVWASLWDHVIDGKMRAQDYANFVMKNAGKEKDTQVLSKILGTLHDPSLHAGTALKYMNPAQRTVTFDKVEKFTLDHLKQAPHGSDLQLVWLTRFLNSAHSPEALKYIRRLYDGKVKISGIKLDQERKWDFLAPLARNGVEGIEAVLQKELQNDPTDSGNKRFIAAQASIPDLNSKKAWLSKILKDPASGEPLPVAKLREAMDNFNILGQEELVVSSMEAYFENLPKFAQPNSRDDVFSNRFAWSMFPSLCDPSNAKKVDALLGAHPEMIPSVVKRLRVAKQEEARCIRARIKSDENASVAER